MERELASLGPEGFRATATVGDTQVRLVLRGNADMEAVAPMAKIVRIVHDAVVESGCQDVVVDLTALEFMNSSSFKALVNWLTWIRDLDDGQRYRVRFRPDPEAYWQRSSLRALSALATHIVVLEEG